MTIYLFLLKKDGEIVILLVYVDNMLIIENNSSLISELKVTSQNNFKIKDFSDLNTLLV